MTSYIYTQADFKSTTLVNDVDLQNQIVNAGLTSGTIQFINSNGGPNGTFSIEIFFDQALSNADKTTLDTLIENYIYVLYDNISAKITDTRVVGTNGGTFTAGSWVTRTLNTIEGSQNFCVLNNNRFTLIPGAYEISVSATAFGVKNHQLRLYDITNSAVVARSPNGYTNSTNDLLSTITTVNISSSTTYEVQHHCAQTVELWGMGMAGAFSPEIGEIYCEVIIQNKSK